MVSECPPLLHMLLRQTLPMEAFVLLLDGVSYVRFFFLLLDIVNRTRLMICDEALIVLFVCFLCYVFDCLCVCVFGFVSSLKKAKKNKRDLGIVA